MTASSLSSSAKGITHEVAEKEVQSLCECDHTTTTTKSSSSTTTATTSHQHRPSKSPLLPYPSKNIDNKTKSKRIITLDLLRKRSEHNEGLVSSLEELALHQEELQSIGPILGRTCGKTLKILLLQNNVIERMDLSEFKFFRSLEYLNLALNNIKKVEGVKGMEWLRKLDLTLNFIDVDALEESINELSECRNLEELFLLGNPCMGSDDGEIPCIMHDNNGALPQSSKEKRGWNGCRAYIVARLPNLKYLDGKLIKRSERILAMQRLPSLISELRSTVQSRANENQLHNGLQHEHTKDDEEVDERYISDDAPTTHDPRTRTKISNEQYDRKQAKERQDMKNYAPKPKGEKEWEEEHKDIVNKARERESNIGRERHAGVGIKQCNQGKYTFWFDEESSSDSGKKTSSLIMRVALPKHLSTSLVDVDIHPTYVSIVIKSKILRVVLPIEVLSDKSVARRSAASGCLELVMPKSDPSETVIGLEHNSGHNRKFHNAINERTKLKTRERLGQSLLSDASGVHKLKIVHDQSSPANDPAADDDEPPPLA